MKKIFNLLFYVLKFILLIAAFGLTLFVLIRMNVRLNKNMITILPELIPYAILLILFIINMIYKQRGVNENVFYNLTCCLVLSTIVLVSLRAILDTNMVLNEKYGYGVDFNFFDNFISYIKIMLYGLSIADILFMFREKDKVEKKSKKLKKAQTFSLHFFDVLI